jgi:hypothetical protein
VASLQPDNGPPGGRHARRAERFRGIAKTETQPRVRARLLELAEQYEELVDDLAGIRPRRP